MPRRKHKKYSKPRKLYDISLLKEENGLIKKYGLKSRREVWKADFAIEKIRNNAKELITADEKDKQEFIERQRKKGFEVESIADVLALSKENYLKRRLESVLVKKGLAKTFKQARQFITHKHVSIDSKRINIPGHQTTLEEENKTELHLELPQKKEMKEEEKQFLESMKSQNKEETN